MQAVVVSAGGVRRVTPQELELRYRGSNVRPDEVVAHAVLGLTPDDPATVKATIRAFQDRRTAAQPRKARTFGSVFKNPPGDRTSGQLIEAVRAQGLRDRRRAHLAEARELHRERRRGDARATSSS